MDSSDMSSPEMRQARNNFPESPDSAAGCQNFFPRGSFGLPDPVAAAASLDGQINKPGERGNGKGVWGKLQGRFGHQGLAASPPWVLCPAERWDLLIPSSPSGVPALPGEQCWEWCSGPCRALTALCQLRKQGMKTLPKAKVRNFCPEGMRCLSWSCGRAQAALPCPSFVLPSPQRIHLCWEVWSRDLTLLAGQSQPC